MNRLEKKLGRFVPEPESKYSGGHFELAMVPAPPEAKFVPASRDTLTGKIRQAHHHVAMACNHCHKDVDIVFPIEDRAIVVSEQAFRNFADASFQEAHRVRREIETRYERFIEPQMIVRRHLDSMADWYDD